MTATLLLGTLKPSCRVVLHL